MPVWQLLECDMEYINALYAPPSMYAPYVPCSIQHLTSFPIYPVQICLHLNNTTSQALQAAYHSHAQQSNVSGGGLAAKGGGRGRGRRKGQGGSQGSRTSSSSSNSSNRWPRLQATQGSSSPQRSRACKSLWLCCCASLRPCVRGRWRW